MGRLTRRLAAIGLALGALLGSAGAVSACTTVEGQLPDPVPPFRLAFVGRVVAIERSLETGYPATYLIQVDRVIYGSLEPGIRRFVVGDGCRSIQAEPGSRVLWALTEPSDLTTWTTAAWRLEPDGRRTTMLTPWREWYPFPERMSRAALAGFVLSHAAPPATAAASPAPVPARPTDPGAVALLGGAAGGVAWLVRSRPASLRRPPRSSR